MSQVDLLNNTIRRSWWIIIVTVIVAVNIVLFLSYRQTALYETRSRLIVSPNPAIERPSDFVDSVNSLDSVVATYAEVLNSHSIHRQAIALLPAEPEDIDQYDFQAVVLPESSVLELTVNGPDPAVAALLANATSQEAIEHIRGLYQIYEISVLDQASVPDTPISPNPKRDATLAGVLGLIGGLVLGVVREQAILSRN